MSGCLSLKKLVFSVSVKSAFRTDVVMVLLISSFCETNLQKLKCVGHDSLILVYKYVTSFFGALSMSHFIISQLPAIYVVFLNGTVSIHRIFASIVLNFCYQGTFSSRW